MPALPNRLLLQAMPPEGPSSAQLSCLAVPGRQQSSLQDVSKRVVRGFRCSRGFRAVGFLKTEALCFSGSGVPRFPFACRRSYEERIPRCCCCKPCRIKGLHHNYSEPPSGNLSPYLLSPLMPLKPEPQTLSRTNDRGFHALCG